MTRQEGKAEAFRGLHSGEPFVIPNPWDAGSARVLEALGFRALATTASGLAFTLGRLDGGATLDDVTEHVAALDAATGLPISVDLENGYGPEPETAAQAISRVAEAGAVGGSIEDWDPEGRLYDLPHAVERVAAAAETAHALSFPFTFTARARTTSAATPTSTTRSRACRRTSKRARTSSTRPASGPRRRSGQCAKRSRDRSTCSRSRTSGGRDLRSGCATNQRRGRTRLGGRVPPWSRPRPAIRDKGDLSRPRDEAPARRLPLLTAAHAPAAAKVDPHALDGRALMPVVPRHERKGPA